MFQRIIFPKSEKKYFEIKKRNAYRLTFFGRKFKILEYSGQFARDCYLKRYKSLQTEKFYG